jgi:hypothetical protein
MAKKCHTGTTSFKGTPERNQQALKSTAVFPDSKTVLREASRSRDSRLCLTTRRSPIDKPDHFQPSKVTDGSNNPNGGGDQGTCHPRDRDLSANLMSHFLRSSNAGRHHQPLKHGHRGPPRPLNSAPRTHSKLSGISATAQSRRQINRTGSS